MSDDTRQHRWEPDDERQGPGGEVDYLVCGVCGETGDGPNADRPCPGESRCERCGHHAGEGCGCPPDEPALTLADMGLRDYDLNNEDRACPKCGFSQMQVIYHSRVVITVGEGQGFPCGAWVLSGILSDQTTQHLCLRCVRCGYGYPTKTADAA